LLRRFVKTFKKKIANFNRKENDMNLQKIFLNAVVGSSLIAFLCCSGSRQVVAKPEKEVNYISYYLKTYEAKDLFEQGNYEKSFQILDSLFKRYEPLNQFMIYEYEIYLKSAYLSSNFQIFPEATIKGIEDLGISDYYFEDVESVMNSVYKKSHIDTTLYKSYWLKYISKIKLELRDTIKEMVSRDRLNNREDWNTFEGKRRLDSIDSINSVLLINVFEKHGYPEESLIGNGVFALKRDESPISVLISGILLHTRDSIRQEYFIPKMWEFVKQGKAPPLFYARMVDQLEIYNQRPQVYGTYANVAVKDSLILDSLRKSIGLPPIK